MIANARQSAESPSAPPKKQPYSQGPFLPGSMYGAKANQNGSAVSIQRLA